MATRTRPSSKTPAKTAKPSIRSAAKTTASNRVTSTTPPVTFSKSPSTPVRETPVSPISTAQPSAAEHRQGTLDFPASPSLTLSFDYRMVDAVYAQELLSLNTGNRKVRLRKVNDQCRDILAGTWFDVADTIRIDTNNELADGQHRLMGLVQADKTRPGISIPMLIAWGVRPEHRVVIDTGTSRSAADQLRMRGYKHTAVLAAAAKWLVLWERRMISNGDKNHRSVTHAEIIEYVEHHPDVIEKSALVSNTMQRKIDMPLGYLATVYVLAARIDPDAAETFFRKLITGAGLPEQDPILALRSRLRELNRNASNLTGEQWLSLIVRCWNAWRQNRKMANIPAWRGTDRDRQTIPVPANLL